MRQRRLSMGKYPLDSREAEHKTFRKQYTVISFDSKTLKERMM